MRKPTKRERREARRLILLAKSAKPRQVPPPVEAARRLMQVRNHNWASEWSDIEYIDTVLTRLQTILDNPTSDALSTVAGEMRATYRLMREQLLSTHEFRAETLGELYTGVSYAHRYL